MRARRAINAAVLPLAAAGLLAGSALGGTTAANAPVVAQLKAVAPAHGGSGQFSATVVSSKSQTNLDWKLSVSHLSGPVTAATLTAGSSGIKLPLCDPCTATRGALVVIPSVWKKLQSGSAKVVIATKAHPKGELSGTLKLS